MAQVVKGWDKVMGKSGYESYCGQKMEKMKHYL